MAKQRIKGGRKLEGYDLYRLLIKYGIEIGQAYGPLESIKEGPFRHFYETLLATGQHIDEETYDAVYDEVKRFIEEALPGYLH